MRLIDVFYSEIQFVKLKLQLPAENFTINRVFVRKNTKKNSKYYRYPRNRSNDLTEVVLR